MTEADADSPRATASPSGDTARRTRRVAYLVLFVAFLDNFAMLPTVAPYAARLGAGLTGVGVAVGAYSVTNLVFNVVGGVLLDRVGRRRLVVASLCLVSAAMLAYPLTGTLESLVAVRLLHGVGGGMLVAAVFTVLGDLGSAAGPGRAMGRAGAIIGAAAVVAPAVAGAVRQVAGFSAVFLAVAAAVAFGAVVAVRALGETGATRARSPRRPSIRALLGRPQLRAACVTAFVFTGAVGSLAAFLPVHVDALGLAAGVTGGLFTLFAVVAAGIMLSRAARIGDVRGMAPPTLAGLGAYAVSLSVLGTGPSPLVMVAAVALFGVGYGLVFPPMAGTVGTAAAPGERGTAYGLFLAFFSMGFVAVPPLGGAIGDATPLSPFAVAVAACLVGCAVTLRGLRPGRSRGAGRRPSGAPPLRGPTSLKGGPREASPRPPGSR